MAGFVPKFGPELDDLEVDELDEALTKGPIKNPEASAAYYAATPGPNSFDIKPTFQDEKGRVYEVSKDAETLDTNVVNDKFTGPRGNYSRLVLWAALPRGETETEWPHDTRETLRLQHMETQTWYEMETDGVFFVGKSKSGHIYVTDWRPA